MEEELDNAWENVNPCEDFEPDYPLEIGDVVLIQNSGHGFVKRDVGKYVEVVEYGDYYGEAGVKVVSYYEQIETKNPGNEDGVVGYGTFGEKPMILLNVNEDHGKSESPLDKRKNGKIRMELVDQGFPLALMELGRVMTWANENKGYKDHDWKQLPDAENGFKGAAARHRVKFDAQRAFGNEMLDCVDEESGIIHLAHEAFNVLALLELALAGKVK